jgi:hypothetical protein
MILKPFPVYNSTPPPVVKSSLKAITRFDFSGLNPVVTGSITEATHTISLTVPTGTDVTTLVPDIDISDKATISVVNGPVLTKPYGAQDFTSSVTYTVTAEDGTSVSYVVVTVSSS